ncbi:adenosine receptor A2b-like [Montipora capricornis]|uniref:adenosine receptor A2b-like n=1 Tax=Montipora capricornis TaxID=246305 RepID=UPI0035F0FD27
MFNHSNFTMTKNDHYSSKAGHNIDRYKYFTYNETVVLINCSLNVPLMVIGIAGNSLVLLAIYTTPSLRSTASVLFLGSLAVSDLLVGLVVQPVYVASGFVRNHFLDSVSSVLSFATCGTSLLSITAVSVDRFLALHYHMRYPTLVTCQRAKLVLAVLWLAIFLLSGIYFWNVLAYFLLISIGVSLCLIISIGSYTRIYRIVQHQRRKIIHQRQAVSLQTIDAPNMFFLKKSAFNSFLFFIVMVIFYLPMCLSMSLYVTTKKWEPAWSLATTAVFMNSSVNPFLYCWRLKELRTAVSKIIKKMYCKK